MVSRRGRPRNYDPEQVLDQALATFWSRGFSATSLDDLTAATGVNRPSLYAGFGDKRAIYLKAMDRFRKRARDEMSSALVPKNSQETVVDVLKRLFLAAVRFYSQEGRNASGCAVVATAMPEASQDDMIRKLLLEVIEEIDSDVQAYLTRAEEDGFLPPGADVVGMSRMITAAIHSIGVRARAGQSRAEMNKMARSAAQLLTAGMTAPPPRAATRSINIRTGTRADST